jgi:hypothetical protein
MQNIAAEAQVGEQPSPAAEAEAEVEVSEGFVKALLTKHPFGPQFFLTQLAAFVRDRCPDPRERLPMVELYLNDGEVLQVCHVIGLTPRWVALAVRDQESESMVTVLVPYECIIRFRIHAASPGDRRVGFAQQHAPAILEDAPFTPEQALRAAASGTAVP